MGFVLPSALWTRSNYSTTWCVPGYTGGGGGPSFTYTSSGRRDLSEGHLMLFPTVKYVLTLSNESSVFKLSGFQFSSPSCTSHTWRSSWTTNARRKQQNAQNAVTMGFIVCVNICKNTRTSHHITYRECKYTLSLSLEVTPVVSLMSIVWTEVRTSVAEQFPTLRDLCSTEFGA